MKLTRRRKTSKVLSQQRRTIDFRLGIGQILLPEPYHSLLRDDRRIRVLFVAAKLELFAREMLGMTGHGDVQHLPDDACHLLVACLQSQRGGLNGDQ